MLREFKVALCKYEIINTRREFEYCGKFDISQRDNEFELDRQIQGGMNIQDAPNERKAFGNSEKKKKIVN